MVTQQNIAIDQIKISRRGRRDPGDLDELAASLRQLGQLQPVVIDGSKRLISGWRRLQAMQQTGNHEITCVIVQTIDEALHAVIQEQQDDLCRQPLMISDAVEIGRRIESLERPKGDHRTPGRQHSGPRNKTSLQRHERAREARKPKTVAAKAVGMSRPTYEKAAAVVDAARQHRRVKPILDEMNRSGNVSRAHRRMREVMESAEESTTRGPSAMQVARRIGSVVDQFISSRPAVSKADLVMAALSESLDRVEKEMIG